jgi:putative ABC transport system substrate-binding protein
MLEEVQMAAPLGPKKGPSLQRRAEIVTRHSLFLAIALTLAAWAIGAWAQQPERVPVVGVLLLAAGPGEGPAQALRKGLRQLGYIEGQNIRIEYRYAQGQADRLAPLARELADLKVDVIVTGAEPIVRVIQQATGTIPIVIVLNDHDPVASGLITSLRRPGGNITGVVGLQSELVGKRLELLKETLPKVSRVAVFWDAYSQRQLDAMPQAARSLGLEFESIELRAPYDFQAAFKAAKATKAGAVMVLFSPVFYMQRARIAALALQAGLPTMNQEESWVAAGGLISYGPTVADTFERAAYFVDRLLKGAKPNDLPVEQATSFKLTINARTAKALGLTIPQSILLRADEVIR